MIFLLSFVEFMSGIGQYIKRINPPVTVMFLSAVFALGWFVTLCINPRFFADSNYLYPLEHMGLTPFIRTVFGAVGALQLSCAYLNREDTKKSNSDIPENSPLREINKPLNYWLSVAGFLIGGGVWFLTAGGVNLSLFLTAGRAPSPQTPFYMIECALSIYYAFVCTVNYNEAKQLRRVAMTMPPNAIKV